MPVKKPTVGICEAIRDHPNGINQYRCRKRADHVLSPGKYTRQHMDTKSPPNISWEPTEDEILSVKTKLGE